MRWFLLLALGACSHPTATPAPPVANEAPEMTLAVRVVEWSCMVDRDGTPAYELVVPAGKLVRFDLTNGDDVALDVELPPVGRLHLAPGESAEVVGRYEAGTVGIQCPVQVAEGAAPNPGTRELRVVPDAEYRAYLFGLGLNGGDVARGEKLFFEKGCIACHSPDGTPKVGSTMAGLWGQQVTLVDGSTHTVDMSYLRKVLADPSRYVRPGFPVGVMPSYDGQLGEADVKALAAYLASLADVAPP